MLKNMLGIALKRLAGLPDGSLGTVCEFLDRMNDQMWVNAARRFLHREDPWAKSNPSQHLERVATVAIPALEAFDAKDHFVVNGPYGFDSSFQHEFLCCDRVMEKPEDETILRIDRIIKETTAEPPTHRSIFAELGDANAETTLGQMYEMLKEQRRGQEGNLTTSACANIFYIRNKFARIQVVSCHWNPHTKAWSISHIQVLWGEHLRENTQIISRCPS